MSNDRREFLKALGVTAAAVAGTGCGAGAAEGAATSGAAAAADATAQVATEEAELSGRSRATTAKFELELDGSFAGWIQSTDGGNAVADVVTEKIGADGFQKKHLAGDTQEYTPWAIT
jgi:TAT (twin-arginine translocation) pathway signal sequence